MSEAEGTSDFQSFDFLADFKSKKSLAPQSMAPQSMAPKSMGPKSRRERSRKERPKIGKRSAPPKSGDRADSSTGTAGMYRNHGEIDCVRACWRDLNGGTDARTACNQPMQGCLQSRITLRQGAMAFAVVTIIWNIMRVIYAYPPKRAKTLKGDDGGKTSGYYAIYLGAGTCAILGVFALVGLFGAVTRNTTLLNYFRKSQLGGQAAFVLVAILFIIYSRRFWFMLIMVILDGLFVWWLFVVVTSLISVLDKGDTGDEPPKKPVNISDGKEGLRLGIPSKGFFGKF